MLRRAAVAVIALLAFAASTADAAQAPLPNLLARALIVPHVSQARSAALAIDLETGTPVFSHNEGLSLAPASNEKLALTYAVLVELGPAFRIETDVLGEGGQHGAVWRGDLVLRGYGDPTLTRAGLRRLAAGVRRLGIRRVTGSVLGDESYFDTLRTAPGWKLSFYLDESPALSALSVDRGHFGGIRSGDPAGAAAAKFVQALRGAGVRVQGTSRTGTADATSLPLVSIFSPPLAQIVRFMNRDSDNYTAELLLKQLGALTVDRGTTAAGATEVRRVLAKAGIPLGGVRIVDGSGLSRLDRLTAAALVGILKASWNDPDVQPTLLASLPVAGVSGTLEDRMRHSVAAGVVVAKTGTTDLASALSGYVRGRYAFAVLENGRPVPFWWARRAQDRFATLLARR